MYAIVNKIHGALPLQYIVLNNLELLGLGTHRLAYIANYGKHFEYARLVRESQDVIYEFFLKVQVLSLSRLHTVVSWKQLHK